MPRPKVRPEDRQRSSRACQACKALKIRCDSNHPCASCIRRGQANSCLYSGTDRRRRKQGVLLRHGHSLDGTEGSSSQTRGDATETGQNPSTAVISFPLDTLFSEPVTPDSSHDGNPSIRACLPERLPEEQGLNSSCSEKVYVGETSSLSFLHFLRKTIKGYVGSVSFTDYERHYTLLDADFGHSGNHTFGSTPEKLYPLLESYCEATSGILDLFTADEIHSLMAERLLPAGVTLQSPIRREDAAALELALAIGAQVRGLREESHLANGYFCRARQIAFDDMLMGQSLSTVRLFLLLAFYMLGACHRNAASMFLGVAARAAIILDLHNPESYTGLQKDECSFRQRIWNSTRNIDVLSSFILGRPKSLPMVRQAENVGEEDPSCTQSAFHAIIKACGLLEDIVDTLSKDNILHVPTAEALLGQLRQWGRGLDTDARRYASTHPGSSGLEPADRQLLMGNIHVSCVYYFAVILICRPYLIAYLTSRLRGKAPDHLISDPDEASDVNLKNNKVSRLGQVCVSSAIYMVDMCRRAKASNFTFGNLCLLKAWIFGAGLVLGFSMFAGEPRRDIESCFEGALEILDDIATTSPQARLYHQILTSFSEAVTKYHHRVASEVRRTVQHYMDQILVIDTRPDANYASQRILSDRSGGANNDEWNYEWLAGAIENVDTNASALDPVSDSTKGAQPLLQMGAFGDTQGDCDDVNMSLGEDFFPDMEPFDQLFYTVE